MYSCLVASFYDKVIFTFSIYCFLSSEQRRTGAHQFDMQHPPLSYAYVKEQINRINKGFCVQNDVYKPNVKEIPVTTKFWSKHESGMVKAGQEGQHATYMKMVEEDLMQGPKHKYDRPMLESHK